MTASWYRKGEELTGASHRELAESIGSTEQTLYSDGWVRVCRSGDHAFLTYQKDVGEPAVSDYIFCNTGSVSKFMLETLSGYHEGTATECLEWLTGRI